MPQVKPRLSDTASKHQTSALTSRKKERVRHAAFGCLILLILNNFPITPSLYFIGSGLAIFRMKKIKIYRHNDTIL